MRSASLLLLGRVCWFPTSTGNCSKSKPHKKGDPMATSMDDVRTILDEAAPRMWSSRTAGCSSCTTTKRRAACLSSSKSSKVESGFVKAIGLKEVHAPESVLGHLNHFNAHETMVRAMIDVEHGGLKMDVVIEVGPGPLDPEVLFVSCARLHHGAKRLMSELDALML